MARTGHLWGSNEVSWDAKLEDIDICRGRCATQSKVFMVNNKQGGMEPSFRAGLEKDQATEELRVGSPQRNSLIGDATLPLSLWFSVKPVPNI
jgi:hypothetical protein